MNQAQPRVCVSLDRQSSTSCYCSVMMYCWYLQFNTYKLKFIIFPSKPAPLAPILLMTMPAFPCSGQHSSGCISLLLSSKSLAEDGHLQWLGLASFPLPTALALVEPWSPAGGSFSTAQGCSGCGRQTS